MRNNLERVLAVARLVCIDLRDGLPPEEAEKSLQRFAGQFSDIIGLMDTLAEVDTAETEPLYWPLSAPAAPPREDLAVVTCSRADILGNAREQDGNFFVVPKIV